MNRAERKQQILNAAVLIALETGYTDLKRGEVAEKLGVTPSLINHYFGTLRKLKRAIMRESIKKKYLPLIAEGVAVKDKVALNAPLALRQRAVDLIGGRSRTI